MDIEQLRRICIELPKTTEDIKWEDDLCFCIGEKMFCVTGFNQPMRVSFKVKKEEFDELCTIEGIKPAPYLARYNWVLVSDINQFSEKDWNHYITQSYQLVKEKLPKKLLKELNLC